ncbi:MAG: bifunctional phosphoribosyl-AMP cyclohydrolase/phosphoribosyl-ATP diphosphatase HisIE [Bacteroidota bacterium]
MELNFEKGGGLLPAIIQDAQTRQVLMLGYMNAESLAKTEAEGKVTFFSRSKGRLWTKGETSGNFLYVQKIMGDCDGDTLLILADPVGPVCHTGHSTCFAEDVAPPDHFLYRLEQVVQERSQASPEESYTARLFAKGINKIAQKVGEEAVETVIDAIADNRDRLTEESADLLYHLLVLLHYRKLSLAEVEAVLRKRHG